jgi:NADPH:quinone reductase-like Zn-dependent oxidoreductase
VKAVRIHEYGDPSVLKYEDAPLPELRENDVLIRVHSVGVNPVDWQTRSGRRQEEMEYPLPLVVGWDFSGLIEDVGVAHTNLEKGDKVYARPDITRDGAYAEYIAVDASEIANVPESVPLEVAASIPLCSLTSWRALFDHADLKSGQTVLIHGAAGGAGIFGIQLAKNAGAHVVATASKDGIDLVRSLGADEVIDYTAEDFTTRGRFADVVYDTVGGDTLPRSFDVVKRGGFVVSITGNPDEELVKASGARGELSIVRPDAKRLAEIAALVDGGKLRSVVTREFPLTDAAAAQVASETRRTRGKMVLRVM